ncbi:MAG: hypothetical protein U0939_01885 [Pirellulales bacterium]
MARKVINRKALREEMDAAEEAGLIDDGEELEEEEGEDEESSEDEGKPKKKAAKATKRKSKAKEPVQVRMKLCWGVYNANKRVALYEFNQKKHADAKAAELNAKGKAEHYVRKDKIPVTEE